MCCLALAGQPSWFGGARCPWIIQQLDKKSIQGWVSAPAAAGDTLMFLGSLENEEAPAASLQPLHDILTSLASGFPKQLQHLSAPSTPSLEVFSNTNDSGISAGVNQQALVWFSQSLSPLARPPPLRRFPGSAPAPNVHFLSGTMEEGRGVIPVSLLRDLLISFCF